MKPSNILPLCTIFTCLCIEGCSYSKVSPSDHEATKETRKYLEHLHAISQKGTLFGQQDALAYGHNWYRQSGRCDFRESSGRSPAIYGWDISGIELQQENNIDNVPFADIESYIKAAHKSGSLNTISWHMNNPLTGGDSWDTGKEVVKQLLPGGSLEKQYILWMDRAADFIERLKDEDGNAIPILFRPFHELTGNWFWWCSPYCSAEDYISLWQYTTDYLRNTKELHNLLLVYSTADCKDYGMLMERYPGDDYTDIIGFDLYNFDDTPGFIKTAEKMTSIVSYAAHEHGKIWAFCETGYESIPNEKWFTQILYPIIYGKECSYAMIWRNAHDKPHHFYGSYLEHPSAPDMKEFINMPGIITNEKQPCLETTF